MKTHCCLIMQEEVARGRDAMVIYLPIFREYVIPCARSHEAKQIFYCPWCKKNLPISLRKEFYKRLKDECNIDTDAGFIFLYFEEMPQEFHSDAWWKKRNL